MESTAGQVTHCLHFSHIRWNCFLHNKLLIILFLVLR